MDKNIKIIIISAVILVVAGVIIFIFMNRPELTLPEKANSDAQLGITFENMGEDFVFSSYKKNELEKKYGNGVLEAWTPINFDDFSKEFLNKFLPDIYFVSQKLEDPKLREKVGKNSIKIKYPYSQRNTKIIKDIHFTFSGFTKTPLLFRVSGYDHKNFLKSLNKNFSEPKSIVFKDNNYYFWEKDNSIMIGEIKQDRLTNPYLSLVIYYTENIKDFFNSVEVSSSKGIEDFF
ncbi:MAG: hypothetical protein RBR53_04505 [Desulforegulaceae bacterium]|nr:hypothetical protein [Desulforegulaceae bacterium]